MKEIKHALKHRLAQKRIAKLSIGAFVVQLAKEYAKQPEFLTGYVRWNMLFLKLGKEEDKTMWFVKRKERCEAINEKLKDFGYEYILKEIRLT